MRLTPRLPVLVGLPLAAAVPAQASAEPVAVKPLFEARLRYEHVDQEGMPREGSAATFRLRAGVEASVERWSLIAETEGTMALVDRYDDGVSGRTSFPIVADSENFELNRLQLAYRVSPGAVVTAGRQRIAIGDQRFVGPASWRANEQTFDAVRFDYRPPYGLSVDVAYAWSVRTIWGIDGKNARQQAVGGDNVFATISHPTPLGTASVFAYLVDQDEAAVSGFRLSSQTYGVGLSGERAISGQAKLGYAASYARQSDHHRNPQDYSAAYYLAEASLELNAIKFGAGYEVLGADDGRALTSFQTPLATLHKFQGWADKFLVTPPGGIRDLYASFGYARKAIAGFDTVSAGAIWHRFESDRNSIDYGTEWDAVLSAKRKRWTFTAKLADYRAVEFAADTRKVWLQAEWAY